MGFIDSQPPGSSVRPWPNFPLGDTCALFWPLGARFENLGKRFTSPGRANDLPKALVLGADRFGFLDCSFYRPKN